MTLTMQQSTRILDDAKRIALITSGIQCNVACLRDTLDLSSYKESMSSDLANRLEHICQCLETKSMLIEGFGNSLYNDIQGMREYNKNERIDVTMDSRA